MALPDFVPLTLARSKPDLTRSLIMNRSNSANTPTYTGQSREGQTVALRAMEAERRSLKDSPENHLAN